MSIPGTEPKWDITEVNSVIPDTDHEQEGWLAPGGVPEKPPFETFNHWMNNVYKWVSYFTNEARRLWQNQKVTHNITVDTDYSLTADQNTYGKVIITDSGVILTVGRNIIVDVSERSFIFQNDTAQILTVKTSAGTGITVDAGVKAWLMCDGTNVIEAVDITGLEIATTVQAQAGTDDTTAISPLKLREGLNAGGSAPVYADRFYVNFDGTGAISIRESGNVSSVTDAAVGDYTANLITAMPTADFAATTDGSRAGVPTDNFGTMIVSQTTTSVRVNTFAPAVGFVDATIVTISAIG